MCRLFAYVGDSKDEIERLIVALSKSAEKDTVAEAIGLANTSHKDGWGYAIYSRKLGESYHRSDKPIFEENVILPPIEGETYAVFHARQATPGTPLGERFSHPFRIETAGGVIYLSHNGSLDRKKLAQRLREDEEANDSELALKYVARMDALESATLDLESYTKPNSALDLLLLLIDRNQDEAKILMKQYYRREQGKIDKTRYYALCFENLGRGKAVFSSTLNDNGFSGKPVTRTGLVSLSSLN